MQAGKGRPYPAIRFWPRAAVWDHVGHLLISTPFDGVARGWERATVLCLRALPLEIFQRHLKHFG
jgi:hypothetical protein